MMLMQDIESLSSCPVITEREERTPESTAVVRPKLSESPMIQQHFLFISIYHGIPCAPLHFGSPSLSHASQKPLCMRVPEDSSTDFKWHKHLLLRWGSIIGSLCSDQRFTLIYG